METREHQTGEPLVATAEAPSGRRGRRRQGYVYMAVLFTTLIVAAVAAASLTVTQASLLSNGDGRRWMAARVLADSAIAHGLARINEDPDWRTTFAHGASSTPQPLGDGTIAFELLDDDTDLSDDPGDEVTLRGIGSVGSARYVRSVRLEAEVSPLGCLQSAIAIDGDFHPARRVAVTSDGILTINGNLWTSDTDSILSCGVAYTGWRSSHYIFGSVSQVATAPELPGEGWDAYYRREGTEIPLDALPQDGSARVIDSTILHPAANPFGETNRLGIYVLDCEGKTLVIRDCRLRATLVVLNPGPGSGVYGSVSWEPAVANFPTLCVDGDFRLETSHAPLEEPLAGANFNPAGFSYDGASDSDTGDRYPSRIRGLVWIDGQLRIGAPGQQAIVEGVLLSRAADIRGDLTVHYRPEYASDSPPGFRTGPKMRVQTGSWRRAGR